MTTFKSTKAHKKSLITCSFVINQKYIYVNNQEIFQIHLYMLSCLQFWQHDRYTNRSSLENNISPKALGTVIFFSCILIILFEILVLGTGRNPPGGQKDTPSLPEQVTNIWGISTRKRTPVLHIYIAIQIAFYP